MTCTVCGKPYPCAHSRRNTSALLEPDIRSSADVAARGSTSSVLSATEVLDRVERERWRREVISRVQQHRARRRRFDPNASLDLAFPAEETNALDAAVVPDQAPVLPPQEDAESATIAGGTGRSSARLRPPKIIRFPRQSQLETAGAFRNSLQDMELADPVLEAPRILDASEDAFEGAPVAEQMELLGSFADIHLEPPPNPAVAEGLPLQPALLSRRMFSGLMDAAIVLAAAAMFAATFLKLAAAVPASRLAGLCALAAAVTIWLMFQYMFLVYGRGTPGMRTAGLELCNFAGRHASRFARRCRTLATVLSGLSLGLGYAWSLVDEDTLGWHDRISGTYLRNSHQPPAVSTQPT
jgi:uncharacterized RDD family membrane protein YckC